jgi:phospholipid/cholesterol/gamma-HCH transport system substrate-binding protein
MNNQRQLLLGAFFVTVLSVLGYYTLFLTDFSLFSEKHEMVVHFPDAAGLREGDTVLVAGMRQGRVTTLVYDPSASLDRRITTTLTMDAPVALRDGFTIHIEDATMLGGKLVVVDPGPAQGAPIPGNTKLFGTVKPGALAGLGELIEENRESVTKILSGFEDVVGDVRGGSGLLTKLIYDEALSSELSQGLTSAKTTFLNLEDVTGRINDGQGVIGRLVTDEDLAGQLELIAANLEGLTTDFRAVAADIAAGKGALGRILNDEQLGEDVAEAVATIREVADRINKGEGTLGRLVVDDEIADRVESILTRVDDGEGTLGLLLSDDEVYTKLSQVADDLSIASAALRNGEGTLGKLVFDDALYRQVEQALDIVTLSLEEYREAAPTTAFTSVLFGAF